MLRAVLALAGATLVGQRRDRVFVCALAVVAFGLGVAHLASQATVDSQGRLVTHFGWLAAGMCGWLLAIGYGSGLADRGGVCGPLALAGPTPTGAVVLGRWLGLAAGLAWFSGLATALLLLALGFGHGMAPAPVLGAGWLLFLRLAVALSLALLFGVLLPRAPAALLSAAVAGAGWISGGFGESGALSLAAGRLLAPRLPLLAPPSGGLPGEAAGVVQALLAPTLYALLYCGALLLLASLAAGPALRRHGLRT